MYLGLTVPFLGVGLLRCEGVGLGGLLAGGVDGFLAAGVEVAVDLLVGWSLAAPPAVCCLASPLELSADRPLAGFFDAALDLLLVASSFR